MQANQALFQNPKRLEKPILGFRFCNRLEKVDEEHGQSNEKLKTSVSDGRASRFKNPPGKRPAAANFLAVVYCKWEKIHSRFWLAGRRTTVASNMVSPDLTTTDPSACVASIPVSIVIFICTNLNGTIHNFIHQCKI